MQYSPPVLPSMAFSFLIKSIVTAKKNLCYVLLAFSFNNLVLPLQKGKKRKEKKMKSNNFGPHMKCLILSICMINLIVI